MEVLSFSRSCIATGSLRNKQTQPTPQPPVSDPFPNPRASQFKCLNSCRVPFCPPSVWGSSQFCPPLRCSQAESSQAVSLNEGADEITSMQEAHIAAFEEFVNLNVGKWSGTFTQYDAMGNVLACIPTKLTAFSFGKGEHCSLCQTLFVRKARSNISISDNMDDVEWAEYKLDEINMNTFDSRQTTYFPGEKAYSISHRTAEMLNMVLRSGLLGDDDDEEENPKGVKLASRRPALVSESCLYSQPGMTRARAFHVVDQRGLNDLLGVFHERMDDDSNYFGSDEQNQDPNRHFAILGQWSGEAIVRRTGVYGSTIAKGRVQVVYEEQENGRIQQEISSDKVQFTKLDMTGTLSGNIVTFSGGLQTTLLPGSMAMTSPVSVGKSVGNAQSFFLEFFWISDTGSRRRLVRTYDVDGVVVSTTLSSETRSA